MKWIIVILISVLLSTQAIAEESSQESSEKVHSCADECHQGIKYMVCVKEITRKGMPTQRLIFRYYYLEDADTVELVKCNNN